MSNRANDSVLRELDLLAALDSVKARIDTSAIAEIQDWSRAIVGKFYRANVEQPLPDDNSSAIAGRPMVVSPPGLEHHVTPEGVGYAQVTASQLVSICLSTNDEASWTEFVRRYQPLIMEAVVTAVRRMRNISSALIDDLVQEVYIKLCNNDFRALRELKILNENALSGFLKVVASNVARDYFRTAMSARSSGDIEKEHGSPKGPHSRLIELTDANSSSGVLEREIFLKEMDGLLQAHSQDPNFERDYTVFWVYFRSGLTAKEISNLPGMGLSVKGVESVLLRMTQQIKAKLTPQASEKKKKENL
jgi:RNA polymerase sigma-70 factor (ECF subfamily)